MNKISFEVIIEEEKEFPENSKETWNIGIEAILDNQKIYVYKHFPINILDLVKSKDKNDIFYIFTCSCGIHECGKVNPITVEHKNGTTFWTLKKSNIEFDQEEYRRNIDLLVNNFLDSYDLLKTEKVEISIYPGIFLELENDEDIISKLRSLNLYKF